MLQRARGQATTITPRPGGWPGVHALNLRLRVWASSLALDCRLAEGARPTSSPELTLRAQQLASVRSRRQLSSALSAAVDTAIRPHGLWTLKPAIVTTGVRQAAEPLQRLAYDLRTLSDPPVRSLALVSFLLCDPTSPLYNRDSPVTVREIAQRARSALVPR
jgi:DICT domain-containing protein